MYRLINFKRDSTRLKFSRHKLIGCLIIFVALASVPKAFAQTEDEPKTPITSICLTDHGQLVSGSDYGLRIHDPETLKPKRKIESEIEKHYSIVSSNDGSKIAVSGGSPSESGIIEVFSVPKMELIERFAVFDDIATDVAWRSADQLVAASMTGNCCLLELSQKDSKGDLPTPFNVHSKPILSIEVLANQEIISTGKDNSIRVWQSDSPSKARVLNNHIDIVSGVAVRPSQRNQTLAMIASVSNDGTARIWQPTIGRMIRFARLDSLPSCVVWNQDGSAAIIGCRDGSVVVLDPDSARQVSKTKSDGLIYDLAICKDDNAVIVATENGLRQVRLAK
ncbi:MAG: hypothetical protein AAFN77_03805 [Planctomycetota bacterium]